MDARGAAGGVVTVFTNAMSLPAACPICLDALAPEDVVAAPCAHGAFHPACFAQWVALRPTCPLCRAPAAACRAEPPRLRPPIHLSASHLDWAVIYYPYAYNTRDGRLFQHNLEGFTGYSMIHLLFSAPPEWLKMHGPRLYLLQGNNITVFNSTPFEVAHVISVSPGRMTFTENGIFHVSPNCYVSRYDLWAERWQSLDKVAGALFVQSAGESGCVVVRAHRRNKFIFYTWSDWWAYCLAARPDRVLSGGGRVLGAFVYDITYGAERPPRYPLDADSRALLREYAQRPVWGALEWAVTGGEARVRIVEHGCTALQGRFVAEMRMDGLWLEERRV